MMTMNLNFNVLVCTDIFINSPARSGLEKKNQFQKQIRLDTTKRTRYFE